MNYTSLGYIVLKILYINISQPYHPLVLLLIHYEILHEPMSWGFLTLQFCCQFLDDYPWDWNPSQLEVHCLTTAVGSLLVLTVGIADLVKSISVIQANSGQYIVMQYFHMQLMKVKRKKATAKPSIPVECRTKSHSEYRNGHNK